MPPTPPAPLTLQLNDGSVVTVRSLVPADRQHLAEAYRRLSPQARYNRFWTHTGEVIGEKMLDRLLDLRPATHQAWAVLDSSRPFPGVAVASWWRNVNFPDEAEFSATVLDGDHGRGIGTLLLAVLWLTAYREGVRHFVAYSLTENRQAVRWMLACGAQGQWDGYQNVYRWDLGNLDLLPATLAAADLAHWLDRLAGAFLDIKQGTEDS